MKKAIVLLLFIVGICNIAQAQRVTLPKELQDTRGKFDPIITLDSVAKLECVYTLAAVDSVLQQGRNYDLILQIGENMTKQIDLGAYLCDSVCKSRNYQMTLQEFVDVFGKYGRRYLKEFYRCGAQITEYGIIVMNHMEYTDSCVRFDWQFHDDTLTVCGYTCRKAVANFRGRTWTAWYTEQIPIDAGPWKLHGLPGLILKASDQNFQHDFEAVAVRKPHAAQITRNEQKSLNKVSRKRFRELEYNAVIDYNGEMEKTGLIQSSSSDNSRGFYSPLELE